jgi:hypothetical protein
LNTNVNNQVIRIKREWERFLDEDVNFIMSRPQFFHESLLALTASKVMTKDESIQARNLLNKGAA